MLELHSQNVVLHTFVVFQFLEPEKSSFSLNAIDEKGRRLLKRSYEADVLCDVENISAFIQGKPFEFAGGRN